MRLTGTPPASLISRMPSHEVRHHHPPPPSHVTPPPPQLDGPIYRPVADGLQCCCEAGFFFFILYAVYQLLLWRHLLPFFSSLTKCDCLSQTSQGALLVYSEVLLFSSVETLILKIRAPCLCNVCSFWLKSFEHATLKGSAVCHHFGLPHKQVSWMSKHFYFRLQHNTAEYPFRCVTVLSIFSRRRGTT